MHASRDIKPADKAVKEYYAALREFSDQQVTHEGALETAFQRLLDQTARPRRWFLVPKHTVRIRGKHIIPDGTLRDEFNLHRGYWEAKDSDDDLEVEIKKKMARGYPLVNTIFEDTRRAVLFQNGGRKLPVDLTDRQALCDLLNLFYAHTEPDIEGFEQAVEDFKERVPELAAGLARKIVEAHQSDAMFQAAFDSFFTLCQTALNPNISVAAVDEMLVQHLLTERLIRKIFDNPEFTRRNVIAAEVEKVITALTRKSFNRDEFLKSLDRFYRAIEGAARVLEDFSEKQHFLNTVYERFFQGYSVKVADTHGIVYTPQEIVDFMCASVAEVLQTEFGKQLGDKDVHILDPCTGTGNFIVNLLRRIPKKDLPRIYRQQLFANEVMLLPYYIAALNIEHAYSKLTGEYDAFEGLCFVDTLDLAEERQMSLFTEDNTARVDREKKAPITVIIGNPPYNANQLNENDNNKNRKYETIDKRVQETYVRDSKATLRNKLYDPYIKFYRWATDRLQNRPGIVCMITNNGFVDGKSFDGFRKHLSLSFDRIYHFDLKGNARTTGERRKREGGNVFSDLIRAGVGISILVRTGRHSSKTRLFYHTVGDYLRAEEKSQYLRSFRTIGDVRWKSLKPDSNHAWFTGDNADEFDSNLPLGSKSRKSIFMVFSTGAKSNRDPVVYGFDRDALSERVQRFIENYDAELDRYKRTGVGKPVDDFVDYAKLKWSSTLKFHLERGDHAAFDPRKIRICLYRPYTAQFLYYDAILNDRPGLFRTVLPTVDAEGENKIICCTNHLQIGFLVQVTNRIANEAVGGRAGVCFPFYVYDENGGNRRENITDWALEQFRTHYKNKKITKWDIFYYVYGLLHHAGYREKFADNLKRDLPRIPLAPDFKAFSKAGQKLAEVHLKYESLEPWPLQWVETADVPLSYHVEKMKLFKDKTALTINPSLTLAKIPPETFQYRLGNRSVLDWVIDQYQVSVDKRSGIRSDPNRADDPEYIVRLVGQVVRVSIETVKIVHALPDFA